MSIDRRLALWGAAPLLAVAACAPATVPIAQADPALGEAVKFNAAVQTINPDPVYAEGSALPGQRGDKAAQAVKRYRSDQVKDVEEMGTAVSNSGGSQR